VVDEGENLLSSTLARGPGAYYAHLAPRVGTNAMAAARISGAMSSAPFTYVTHDLDHSADLPQSRWRICFGGVVLLVAILFFTRLGARALWSSEFRWAEIAREMITTHNYFWPTIDGQVYYDKPLGSYWLILWSTWLTGAMNEAAARLPGAVAGLLAVVFVMLLAGRLYDRRTALFSGIVLATSFSFVFFSRHASADVETLTGELAALLLFVRHEHRQDGWWVIALWVVMAITSLTKGLLGFVLPIMTIGVYCLLASGWTDLLDYLLTGPIGARTRWIIDRNRWLFNWKSVVAIALGAAIYYAPFSVSHHAEGSAKGLRMVWRENVVRFFHPFDHRGPVYLYLYVIFALAAPWSALLPAALIEVHKRRTVGDEPARGDRFALVYFWVTFAFFTISGSRRSYYLLPILPAAALLIARLLAVQEFRSRWARRLLGLGFAIVALATVGAIIAVLLPAGLLPRRLAALPPIPDPIVFGLAWILSVLGIVYAVRKYTPFRVGVSMAIIAYASMAYIYLFAMPAADAYRGEKPLALQVAKTLDGDLRHLAYFRTEEGLFYLNPRAPLPEYEHAADLIGAIHDHDIEWVLVRRKDLAAIATPNEIVLSEPSFAWEDEDQKRNKVVLVKLTKPKP
jgi:4-amino-4-deoxy-L-arabinose transferase-like glycosyltransferase